MSMLPQEIIRKKRDGIRLNEAELRAFFYGFLEGSVADYQVGAMLMAIWLKDMSDDETATLTRLMRDSGTVIEWEGPRTLFVDKHSTGGIGDKTSLVLLPLCILEGLRVPMMAGRGLGHTGGTLDKLEAVGWNVHPSVEEAKRQVRDLGGIIMGQTDEITPLDKRLYAMRDVTATVESIPLIVGSILSKKLAEGVGGLVMDVKFGSGAFMRDPVDAAALARKLRLVGEACGLNMRCLLTSMDSPLGTHAGNALEVFECIELMQGRGPADTRELVLELGIEMVRLAFPKRTEVEVRASLAKRLNDGTAFAVFRRVAEAQGGDLSVLDEPSKLLSAKVRKPVVPAGGGVVRSVDVRELGVAILELGGGRRRSSDKVDPAVGLVDMKRVGATLAPGEPVATIHASDSVTAERAALIVSRAYEVVSVAEAANAPHSDPLIRERI